MFHMCRSEREEDDRTDDSSKDAFIMRSQLRYKV